MNTETILVIILTLVLWRAYHSMFRVTYSNFLIGAIRELGVCLIISLILVQVGANLLDVKFFEKDPESEIDKSTPAFFQLPKKQEKPGYMGVFHNLEFLNGSGFDTTLMMEESASIDNGVNIQGFSGLLGTNYIQSFVHDMEHPEGDALTWQVYTPMVATYTITVTYNADNDTLSVVQESDTPNEPTPYTGEYVRSDIWWGELKEQVEEATNAAMAAQELNKWIDDYFGSYEKTDAIYDLDSGDSHQLSVELYSNGDSAYFNVSFMIDHNPMSLVAYKVPYPRGDSENLSIDDGTIGISYLATLDDGRHMIEITRCPYDYQVGAYIQE